MLFGKNQLLFIIKKYSLKFMSSIKDLFFYFTAPNVKDFESNNIYFDN